MVANGSYWKNKTVLVTGYEGFLGSWLTRFLLEAGCRVTGLDIRTRRRDTVLTKQELAGMKVVRASVADYPLVLRLIRQGRVQCVFHLAAEALVGECLKDPLKGFTSNIQGTWNVLEACRQAKTVRALVAASSDKAYGSHRRLPYAEDFALQGDHPYDVSKSCADLLCATYAHTYKTPVCVTRCGNLYGPGDFNFSRLVPEAMRCAITGRTLLLRSDGNFVRDYVYVKDIAAAYMLLAASLAKHPHLAGEAFNFSDEKPLSVKQVVRMVYGVANAKPKLRILDRARFEIRDQYLDASKARRLLTWKPAYTMETAMQETLAWYRRMV